MKTLITTTTHKIIKYIFYILGGIAALLNFVPNISFAEFMDADFPYEIQWQENVYEEDAEINLATLIKADTQDSKSLLTRLTDFFRLSGTSYSTGTSRATNYVKWILNILLGLVSFLSLVMVIFAFYLIFFSKWEEAVWKAKKILVGVGIALTIMWLSWFIASFFFDIYTTVT